MNICIPIYEHTQAHMSYGIYGKGASPPPKSHALSITKFSGRDGKPPLKFLVRGICEIPMTEWNIAFAFKCLLELDCEILLQKTPHTQAHNV